MMRRSGGIGPRPRTVGPVGIAPEPAPRLVPHPYALGLSGPVGMPPEPPAVLVPNPYAPGLVGPVGVPPDPPAELQPHIGLGLICPCALVASAMNVAHSSHETVDRTAFVLTRLPWR